MSYLKQSPHQSINRPSNLHLTLLLLLGCLIQLNVSAQNTWVNYANDHLVFDQALEGDTTLWIGSQNGLAKINLLTGEKETFQAWNSPLRGQGVRGIAIRDGVRWFGADYGGFFREENGDWQHFVSTNTGNDLLRVENIQLDAEGNPWFFSTISETIIGKPTFMSYNDQFSYFVNHSNILETDTYGWVKQFMFTENGDMWVLQDKRLVRYDGELILEEFDVNAITPNQEDKVYDISVDSDGNLWATASIYISLGAGAGNGYSLSRVLKYDGNAWTVEFSDLRSNVAYVVGQDGSFWVNSFDIFQNTYTYRSLINGVWTIYNQADLSIIPNSRYSTPQLRIVDSDGAWWVHSNSGVMDPKIHKIENNEVTSYSSELFPLGANYYDTVIEDCDGNIWILERSVFSMFDGEKWTNYNAAAFGLEGFPQDAFVHPETCDIWMSLYYNNDYSRGTIAVFDGENLEILSYENLEISDREDITTYAIDLAPDGTIYGASVGRGLISYKEGVWTDFDDSHISENLDYLYNVRVQSDNTIWLATFSSIVRIKGNDYEVFDETNSPVSSFSRLLYFDSSENLWTRIENGLAKWDGSEWETFVFEDELENISNIVEDKYGNFWLSTTQGGAYYWNGADFLEFNYLNSDISSNYVKEIFIDESEGDIWCLHSSGVSVLQDFTFAASISGAIYYDEEQDGIYDPGIDVRLPNQRVMFLPDSTIAITNTIGSYAFYPEEIGAYSIENLPEASYTVTSPSVIDTVYTRESIKNLDFGLWLDDIPEGVNIDITTSPIICHGITNFWITLENEGFNDIAGDLILNFNPEFKEHHTYPDPDTLDDGQVKWEFSNLGFREIRRFDLRLETPGVDFLDQEFIFQAEVNTENETYMESIEAEILCSYDPNDKMAKSVGESRDNFSLLGDPIQYTIRFQNLGNYKATNVFITDEIDESLDISSIRIISSSHEFTSTLRNREITFRFDGIDLPPEVEDEPGSHGFIKFEIAPVENLPDPTVIENTADIFFDQNPAIVTNTTESILVEAFDIVSTNSTSHENRATIFPNPSSSDVWISWSTNDEPWSIKIYDLSGRLYSQVDSESAKLMILNMDSGFYMFEITKGNMTQIEKVVVTK